MAYPCATARCDAIPNFSNPNVAHVGAPTGTATQNNALSINNIAAAAANWRQTAPAAPPGPPTALQAVDLGNAIMLSWTASASGGIATGFVLQIGRTPGSADLYAGPVGHLPTVSGPVPPGQYFWQVTAVNALGTSAPSAEAQFTIAAPSPPPAPTNLFSQVAGNTVTLTWSASLGTPATSSYILQVGRTTGASDVFAGAIGNRTSISGTVPNGTYFWRLLAVNAVGNGPPSVERQFSAGCTLPPGATRSLSATRNARTVTLNWLPPLTGGPPTQYVIEVGSTAGLSDLLVFATGNTATFLSTQAPPGTFYVRVRAQNSCGSGAASNEQLVVVP
jgi:predicted phage tail protein